MRLTKGWRSRRRWNTTGLDLHDALLPVLPDLQSFIVGEIDGEQLWYRYDAFTNSHGEEWHRHAWYELDSMLYRIDDCVPDGATPDEREVDETELRGLVAELLDEAGHEVDGQARARSRIPLRTTQQRSAALAVGLDPYLDLIRPFLAGDASAEQFASSFAQRWEEHDESEDWYVRDMIVNVYIGSFSSTRSTRGQPRRNSCGTSYWRRCAQQRSHRIVDRSSYRRTTGCSEAGLHGGNLRAHVTSCSPSVRLRATGRA